MEKKTYGAYRLLMDWKTSGDGYIVVASKEDRVYLLRQYRSHILPDEAKAQRMPRLYSRLKKEFEDFMAHRIAVNTALAGTKDEGSVNYPTDWFVCENRFIEASPFLPNVMDGDDIEKLPIQDIYFIMKEAAKALSAIHRCKVAHGNLNYRNIVAMKGYYYGSPKKYLVKITDFSGSFPDGEVPPVDVLGCSQQVMSPELAECFITDFHKSALAKLSMKTDIFSLATVFYRYLTGKPYPTYRDLPDFLEKREYVYPGEALYCGGKIVLDREDLKEDYIVRLLANMLHPDPQKRPTAQEVVEVLEEGSIINLPDCDSIITEF